MVKSNEKTNTGEGVKDKRGRTDYLYGGRLLDTVMIDLMWDKHTP
jgi:hypothetical protein